MAAKIFLSLSDDEESLVELIRAGLLADSIAVSQQEAIRIAIRHYVKCKREVVTQ